MPMEAESMEGLEMALKASSRRYSGSHRRGPDSAVQPSQVAQTPTENAAKKLGKQVSKSVPAVGSIIEDLVK